MNSKTERIIFSWREDHYVYFAEQFEDQMSLFKIGKILTGDAINEDCMPTVRNGASEEHRKKAVNKKGKN